jgi:tetratricopeptide (TPR) repeat protein
MPAIPHVLIPIFIIVSSLAEVANAGPQEAHPSDGRELEVALDLLHQAKHIRDSQYQASPTSGYHYTDDLAAALAELGDHDSAEATSRHGSLGSLAVGYARGGDMLRVRQTIARIQDASPGEYQHKPWTWLQVGQALAKSGRKELAGEAFAEAVSCSPKVSAYPSLNVDLSLGIAEGLHGIGQVDKSLAALDLAVSRVLADQPLRIVSLWNVVETQAKLGFLTQALATADLFDEPRNRSWAWFHIVDVEAKAGRLSGAYRIAEKVKGSAVHKTWMAIADAESKAGHLSEAKQALRKAEAEVDRIAEVWYRTDMIVLLAQSNAALGDRDAAVKWLERAVASIEGNVAVEGRMSAVLKRAEQVPGAVDRQFNLRKVAGCQAKLGLTEAAKRTFERAKVAARGENPGMWRDSALTVVAASQADAGMPEEAMQTLAELPEGAKRWSDYVPIAKAKVRAGDLDGAMRVTEMKLGDGHPMWGYIADTLLATGDTPNALRIALRSANTDVVLHDSARRLAASGDLARVTDAVPRAYVNYRVPLLVGAAEGLLDRARRSAKRSAVEPVTPSK